MTAEIMQRKRRVSLTVEEMAIIVGALAVTLSHYPIAVTLKARLMSIGGEEQDPEHRRITDAYRKTATNTKDNDTEIDDDAEVTLGDDPGAYVMGWFRLPAEIACERCAGKTSIGDSPDGYLCPECNGATFKIVKRGASTIPVVECANCECQMKAVKINV